MANNGLDNARDLAQKYGPPAAAVGVLIILAVAALSRVGCANHHVPPGYEGYVESRPIVGSKEFLGTIVGPSSTGWVWRQKVSTIDMRPRTKSERLEIITQGEEGDTGSVVKLSAHILVKLRRGSVRDVVNYYQAERWYESAVQPPLKRSVRALVERMSPFEVKDRIVEIGNEAKANLVAELKARHKEKLRQNATTDGGESPFEILSVNIGNIEYPERPVKAIIDKFVTRENNELRDIQDRIADEEIKIGEADAKGTRDAQELIGETLDPMYLQFQAVRAIEELADSKNTTFVLMPFSDKGGSPLIMSLGNDGRTVSTAPSSKR